MDFNVCHECGTENEQGYIYCKNCGAKLSIAKADETAADLPKNEPVRNTYTVAPDSNTAPQNSEFSPEGGFAGEDAYFRSVQPENPNAQGYGYQAQAPQYEPMHQAGFEVETIDGIPVGEIGVFIGKKTDNILPKFRKMEITGSKVSWCWPVAVLSFFFGPMGAALWFFYRKMYKAAIILMAIGIVASGLSSALTAISYDPAAEGSLDSFVENYYDSPPANQEDLEIFFEEYFGVLEGFYPAGAIIEQITSSACLIITGIFAYYWYKNHAVSKINAYRQRSADMRYYQFGLMSIGGTSGGMLAVGIVIMIAAENIISQLVTFVL